jgi:hypothetical protein
VEDIFKSKYWTPLTCLTSARPAFFFAQLLMLKPLESFLPVQSVLSPKYILSPTHLSTAPLISGQHYFIARIKMSALDLYLVSWVLLFLLPMTYSTHRKVLMWTHGILNVFTIKKKTEHMQDITLSLKISNDFLLPLNKIQTFYHVILVRVGLLNSTYFISLLVTV